MKLQELKNRFNKKYAVRIIAGVLSIALIGTGSAFYGVANAKAANEKDEKKATVTAAADEGILSSLLSGVTVSKKEIGKEESVYLITDASGAVTKTIVSDRLANLDGKDTITDKSNLSNIVNVKGDEEYTENAGNLTWQANGNDISYQGTTEAAVPVSQKVTYYLDGKEIAPEDLAGQSGKVTIRFDYTNNSSYTATVNGKKVETKVPFAAISAVMLNDDFTNVEVTNGQAKTADGKSVVIGYALPGMTEALGVEEGQIPEYFEITADVKNFELKTAMTLVVNAANYASTNGIDLDTLDSTVSTLADAAGQLKDGSSELATGLDTLKDSLVEFVNGMQTLNSGKDALASGVSTLNTSAGSLNEATKKLQAALQATLTDTEKAQYAAMATTAVDNKFAAGTLEETSNKIYAGLRYQSAGVDSALYTTLYNGALKSTVDAKYVETVHGLLVKAVYKAQGGSFDSNGNMTNATLAGALNAKTDAELAAGIEAVAPYSSICAGFSANQLAEYLYSATDAASATKTGLTLYKTVEATVKAQGGAQIGTAVNASITAIADSMAGACQVAAETAASEALVTGITAAKSNILAQLEAKQPNGYSFITGMAALSAGTQQLNDSVPSLTAGITKLTDASLLIQDGVNKLDDGSHKLADGILQFNEEGIEKLVNAYNGDVKELADKIQAVLDAGEDYQVFTDIADNTNGSVKFIYKLGSVTVK